MYRERMAQQAAIDTRTADRLGAVVDVRDVELSRARRRVAHFGPVAVTIGPMAIVELERVEALELLGMVLAHLNDAEARHEMSARVPTLMGIRDKLAGSLREDQ